MIKAQDLRIGNLLIDVEDRICKVERIYEDDWTAYAIKGTVTTGTPYPITLTEEILLKCGFFDKQNTNWGKPFLPISDISYLGVNNDGKIFINGVYPNCVYLHQLQNIYFALTGKELNTSGLI